MDSLKPNPRDFTDVEMHLVLVESIKTSLTSLDLHHLAKIAKIVRDFDVDPQWMNMRYPTNRTPDDCKRAFWKLVNTRSPDDGPAIKRRRLSEQSTELATSPMPPSSSASSLPPLGGWHQPRVSPSNGVTQSYRPEDLAIPNPPTTKKRGRPARVPKPLRPNGQPPLLAPRPSSTTGLPPANIPAILPADAPRPGSSSSTAHGPSHPFATRGLEPETHTAPPAQRSADDAPVASSSLQRSGYLPPRLDDPRFQYSATPRPGPSLLPHNEGRPPTEDILHPDRHRNPPSAGKDVDRAEVASPSRDRG